MSVFDIIILILLFIEAVTGFRRGFVEMIFYIASIFVALYIAKRFSGLVVGWIDLNSAFAEHLAYIITFIATIVIVIVAAKLLGVIIQGAGFGVLNKLGGAVLGIMKSVLVLGFLFIVFEGINQRERFVSKKELNDTFFYNYILTTGEYMLPYLPIDEMKVIFNEFSIPKEKSDKADDK